MRLLVIAVAAFALGYVVTAFLFFGTRAGDEVVTVPDLRGRTMDEAVRLAEQAGLATEAAPPLENPNVPEGVVLTQVPLPGEEASPGSVLRLTASAGPERRRVPDVTALPGEQARELLERSGFSVAVDERTSPLPAGRVIEMFPPAGSLIELPAGIRLVVSSGPPFTTVPDLTGMRLSEAGLALEAAGLRLGTVDHDPLAQRLPGEVIGQWPAGGDQAREGSRIGVTVAGSPPAPAPDAEPANP